MAKNFSISIKLEVLNKFTRPLQQINSSLRTMGTQVSKLNTKLRGMVAHLRNAAEASRKMRDAGKRMSLALTAPIAALGFTAIRTREAYEKSMNKVAAVTQATGDEFKAMDKLAQDLGRTTQFSASQAADAMTYLGMAGLNVQQVMEALPGTLELAAAGGLELADAADIATNVMTAMGKSVKDLGHINDVLSLAQAKSNTNVYELAEAMRPVAGTADTLGVSIEQVVAMLGKMADAGEKGSIAGTLLRNALLSVVDPGDKAKGELARLGVNLDQFVTREGKLKNFFELITLLKERGATTAQIFTIFGERGARAVLTLQKKGKDLKEFTKLLEESDGTAKKMAETMMKGLPGAMKRMSSAWEGLMLKLTDGKIGKAIEAIIDKITAVLNWISDLDPLVRDFIVTILAFTAAVGPLLIVLGSLNLLLAANPFVLVGLAVGALIALLTYLATHIQEILDLFEELGNNPLVQAFLKATPVLGSIGGFGIDLAQARKLDRLRQENASGLEKGKSETDIKLKVTAEGGAQVTTESVKKKGNQKVELKTNNGPSLDWVMTG